MKGAIGGVPCDTATAFYVGGEDLLAPKGATRDESEASVALEDIRIRIGTLLKAETVSFLLGAGAAVDCGGQLIGSVPVALERSLVKRGVAGSDRQRVRRWLKVFYLAARHVGGENSVAVGRQGMLNRAKEIEGAGPIPLPVNLEKVLAQLHFWRTAIPEGSNRLRLDGTAPVDVTAGDLERCIAEATRALAAACDLPTAGKNDGLTTFITFLRKVLTRPLNLKRANIFTLNYDTLVEQAADAEGVVLRDGFVGTQRRVFRPESYEQDLYFPAETTEGRVHRFDRVLHLYKLHGSISWTKEEPCLENPYGVAAGSFEPANTARRLLIYPIVAN